MEIIKIRDDFIKLGQALKLAGLVESGVDDDVLILCSFVGFRSSRHVDRFQDIRLTLRVISIENICAAAGTITTRS